MPTESKWEAPAVAVSYLAGGLDGLLNGANDLGATVAGETDNELYIDLEIYLAAQGSSRDADGRVEIYILYDVAGNFDMGDDSTDPRPESLLTVFSLDAATTARYRTATNLPLAPFDFKLLVMNETGQAFAATGNTLKYRLHSAESQ